MQEKNKKRKCCTYTEIQSEQSVIKTLDRRNEEVLTRIIKLYFSIWDYTIYIYYYYYYY